MTAERGQLIGGNTRQPRRPILRICEDGRNLGEFLGKGGLLVVQLRADVEAHREVRREGFVEGGAQPRIGVADFLRIFMFIVDDRHGKRAVPGKECCGGAMGGDRNGVEAGLARKALQRIARKGPEGLYVVMRIETGFDRDIRPFQDGDLGARLAVEHDHLGIGLADVEDGDAAIRGGVHGIWKTVTRSLWTGELSGLVAMISAMCAHHFFMTGWSGRLAILWSAGRVNTPNSVLVSRSR